MLKHVKATSTYQLGRGTTEAAFTSVSGRVGWKPTGRDAKGPTLQSFGTKNLKLRRISLNDMNHDKRHISARFWQQKKRQKFPIFFPADTSTSSHMQVPSPSHEVEIPHPGGSNLTQRRGLRSLLDRGSHGNVGLNAKRYAKVKGSWFFFL